MTGLRVVALALVLLAAIGGNGRAAGLRDGIIEAELGRVQVRQIGPPRLPADGAARVISQ